MSNDSNNSVLAVVLAFFTGGLIGSALAVLLTPFSGRETRERIVESTIDTREKTKQPRPNRFRLEQKPFMIKEKILRQLI